MFLSIVQLVVVSILSLVFAIFTEKIILADILSVIWPLLAVGVLSSGVGYTLQIIGQKKCTTSYSISYFKFRVDSRSNWWSIDS